MTAHAHISKDEKYKEMGMDDFVLKPFDPQQLFNKIAKYVQQNNTGSHHAGEWRSVTPNNVVFSDVDVVRAPKKSVCSAFFVAPIFLLINSCAQP